MLLFCFLLLSCSVLSGESVTTGNPPDPLEDAAKARENGPLEGDVCVINGVEYVYGKNVRYASTPFEAVYVWLPRDAYTPSLIDTLPGRVGYPTKRSKELSELEERLARLERAGGRESPPKTASPEEPVRGEGGRAWTRYFRNEDGVEWFLDGGTFKRTRDGIELWRRRTFPRWAFQKEIVTLDDLNCREERYRTLELRVTGWDGSSRTSDRMTPWANVYSSSPEHYLMQEYCN